MTDLNDLLHTLREVVGSQQLLLGPGLSFLQKPCRLFAGTEQL